MGVSGHGSEWERGCRDGAWDGPRYAAPQEVAWHQLVGVDWFYSREWELTEETLDAALHARGYTGKHRATATDA